MIDFDALLFRPAYRVFAEPAILKIGAVTYQVDVIDGYGGTPMHMVAKYPKANRDRDDALVSPPGGLVAACRPPVAAGAVQPNLARPLQIERAQQHYLPGPHAGEPLQLYHGRDRRAEIKKDSPDKRLRHRQDGRRFSRC